MLVMGIIHVAVAAAAFVTVVAADVLFVVVE
jgi:hypothetical protein